MIYGKIHSMETLGALDGPGIRIVVFFQGCKLRCLYCHNPDTWLTTKGLTISSDEIINKAVKYKPYFKFNSGGMTFSGGEPLMQPKFLLECLKKCKEEGIHTVLDTSGVGYGNYDEILKYTDLVILDVKHSNPEKYKKITGVGIELYYEFKESIIKSNKDIWLKQVVTPGINDTYDDMMELEKEINSFPVNIIQKVELLPYHTLGVSKYDDLKLDYRLKNTPILSKGKMNKLKGYLNIDKLV
nr:pyruvate formate-lyase-activating protein [Sedimentibacter sp.]